MTTQTHLVPLPDGRALAVDDTGPADGGPVLLLPSAPGSRALDPDPAATTAAGVRLLVTDRPGYGKSTPLADGVVASWPAVAADHVALLDALDLDRVDVVGWSNGGLGAIALAALHPSRVRSLTVVGSPAPHDEVPWVPEEFWGLLLAMRQDPGSALAQLAPALAPMAADVDAALAGIAVGPADDKVLGDPAVAGRLRAMLAEGLRDGALGVATDIVATNVDTTPVPVEAIACPVGLRYGAEDLIVGPEHGRYWASVLPGADLRVAAGAGHLLLVTEWPDILATLPG